MNVRASLGRGALVLTLGVLGPASHGQDQPASVLDSNFLYTPVTPCRVADTRLAALGALAGNATRRFDLDGVDFHEQGGNPTGCGIPEGVARAVAMTIVAVQPTQDGFLTAWASGPRPLSSVLNYSANAVIANMAIVPVDAGPGADFSVLSLATTHLVIDVVGYYTAPVASLLDCITVTSEVVSVAVGVPTVVTASCPADRSATGGGFDKAEGTPTLVGVFAATEPFGNGWRTLVENQSAATRDLRTFVRCCRTPGR